jgi:hypothetical protein
MRSSLLLLLLPFSTFAQNVFEWPASVPAFGDHPVETRSYGVVPGLVTGGSSITWDFSALSATVVGTITDQVLQPAETPYAGDYPGATHCVRFGEQYGYYAIDAQSVRDLGYRLSAGSPSFIYSDPAEVVRFPAAVGDSWTDATLSGTTATTLTVTILAEGTIVLADAVIPDAVLVRRVQQSSSTTATSNTWFRRGDPLRPLGNVLANGTVIVRVPQELITQVPERDAPSFSTHPQPFVTSVRITATSPVQRVDVFDAGGRLVRSAQPNASSFELDLAELPAGTYCARATFADRTEMLRLLKE